MASNILPLFWPLANSSKDTRLTASASLVSNLENFQQSFIASKPSTSSDDNEDDESDDDEEDEIDDDDESGMEVDASDDDDEEDQQKNKQGEKLDKRLSKDNAEDVVYCVKRLIRGLGSSRESSRLGFAVALTELLSRIETVSVSQVISLLIRNSQYSKNMKGSDERDMMFARLFGLNSIIQSKSLFNLKTSTLIDFENVINELITLGESKAWMRESAWWTLIGSIQGLLESNLEWKDEALKQTINKVFVNSDNKSWNQEKVALVLLLENKVKNIDWKSHLSPTFKHTPLLNSHNLVTLGRVLKEASAEDDESVAASTSGNWKPQLHFVWNIILEHYFPKSGSEVSINGEAPFQDFFRVVVDESLFSNTASPQRRYWGFQVFEKSLPLLSSSTMPLIFTPNFMRCWMNNLSSSDRYLHKAALQIAKKVQDVTKQNQQVGFTLLSQLIGKYGKQDFDKVTKTKTVESIMSSLNVQGTKDYVKYLQDIIVSGGGSDNLDNARIDERRLWALDQLLALFRNGSVPKDDEWISSVIDFLLVHGFFLIRKADKKSPITALQTIPKPALSESTAAACRSKLSSCLVEITTASVSQRVATEENKTNRQQGCDLSGRLWVRRTLDTLALLEKNNKHVEITTEADDEIVALRKEALETLQAIEKVKEDQKEVAQGVAILLAFFVLQTYDDVEDALELLENTNSAAQKLFNISSTSTKDDDEDEHLPIDSLLDVLIALLDKGSNDLRNLANMVFGMVSSAFTESSIDLLTAQLEQTVADAAADLEDVEDEDDDEDISDNDDEDKDDDEEEEMSEVEDDDEDDLPDVDPAFRQRVAEALNVAGLGVDDAEDKDDDEESEEEYMDDDQMMKVDEQLAEVFRQQAASTKKTDLKHLQIESLHFKNRILDFFDVYSKKQISNPLILPVVLSLLKLVRGGGSSETELANKAAGILRSKFNKPKEVCSTASNEKSIEILKEIHSMAIKAHSAEFSNLCSLTSLFVVKTIESSSSTTKSNDDDGDDDDKGLIEVYSNTLKDFMSRKSSLVHPNFILEFIKRFPQKGFKLSNDLIEYVKPGKGVNTFRQLQGYSMLSIITSHLPSSSKSSVIPSDKIEEFIKSSSEAIYETLQEASIITKEDGSTGWNATKLKDLVKFSLNLARISKSLNKSILMDLKKVEEIKEILLKGEKTKEMKGVLSMWNQLIAILGGKAKSTNSSNNNSKNEKENKRKNIDVEEAMDVDGDENDDDVAKEVNGVEKKKSKKNKITKTSTSTSTATDEEPSKKKKKVVDGEKKKSKKAKTTSS
ncbi:uncharacterized protein L201_002731 [Kwoniella dendrophila CBS 6074]|uniref:DNA polymerase phi subunit n=1 Tax=Kwoniella dendrophila CBS 6074 TaxID=1295534 RepID=A0AAX4JT90_9TREE